MKNRICINYLGFLFLIIMALQCNKTNSPNDQGDSRFIGKWNWVKTAGGDFAYIQYTPPPIIKLIFDNNNCTIYRNDTIISERHYYLTREKTIYLDTQNVITFVDIQSDTTIRFYDAPIPGIDKYSYGINNDSLFFGGLSGRIGEFGFTYTREY